MAKSVCLYLHVHQPWRLSKLNILNLGQNQDLFVGTGDFTNKKIFHKVAKKSYYPTNQLLSYLIKTHGDDFKVSMSISGVLIDQAEAYDKKVLNSFKRIVDTGNVEILTETYYHSLAWLNSKKEFAEQIALHRSKIWQVFKKRPTFFRNTELIYNNEIATFVKHLGFEGIIAEGWDKFLKGRSPNYVYTGNNVELHPEDLKIANENAIFSKRPHKIKLLLKNYKLSDDIAFRFSNVSWEEYPLTVEKYADWIEEAEGDTINLFVDYETFGEHQWEETGIFKFMKSLVNELISRGIKFKSVSDTVKEYKSHGEMDVPELTSWADESRDLTAWIGDETQRAALNTIYDLESRIIDITRGKSKKELKDEMLEFWRRLQTSDHFYYMCTKFMNDGDVHEYFSPYDSPYDAYINFMNCYNDFLLRVESIDGKV